MFSIDDLFNTLLQSDDEDIQNLNDWKNDPTINQTDWWGGNFNTFDKKIPEEIKVESTELDGSEVVNSDTILANTFFTYFDSSIKPLSCIIRDTKPGEVRCLGMLSSGTYDVTITTENKKKFVITASSPFLNLYYVKDVGYVESEPMSRQERKKLSKKHRK
jgi:hypothetical protein